CGEYLSKSAFLMILMSISSITTSILNSMGLEHKTLIYYIISGGFMLLSIWFLPSVMGVYSLLVGFSFIYGLTSLLNLILLNKYCPQKPHYKKFLFGSIGFCLPTFLLGFMLEKLLLPVIGSAFTVLICGGLMIIFNILLYIGFGFVSVDFIKSKLPKLTANRA
ncbi:MAG: polysaccharide biosynthesis C-terminal domain-containing protein, partial [Clostridia bacterium]|nr:polysaccharide biosynthesis C-terminal domain-containing protein [Clostridia bacterium]